jgi:gluconate 2-dehydrogenase gamma chain
METRRGYLKIIGAVSATCAFPFSADELYGQEHAHAAGAPHFHVPVVGPFEPKFFTAAEGQVVSRLADLMIPPTDTPGAVAAGVPQYIDTVVGQNPRQQAVFREGIVWLEAAALEAHQKKFLELREEMQVAMLTPLCAAADSGSLDVPGVRFFSAVKNLTADGYYTSYAGLVQELGYQGNQVLSRFEGCLHEH